MSDFARWERLEKAEREVERLRQGLLACATEAGEDVSDGIPTWPDIVEWAVRAVRESRAEDDAEIDRLAAQSHERWREGQLLRNSLAAKEIEIEQERKDGDALRMEILRLDAKIKRLEQ